MEIKFNGVYSPNFLIINDIRFPVLPEVSQNTVKVNGRAGLIDFGNEIAERVIEVDVTLKAYSAYQYREYARQLSEWLYYDYPAEFIHPEDGTKYVMAKVSGAVDLQEILHLGQGTIQFICTDPYIYALADTTMPFYPTPSLQTVLDNTGNATCYPKFDLVFAQNTTEFSIVSDEEYLRFGESLQVDTDTEIDLEPLVMNDDMSAITGSDILNPTSSWIQSSSVDGGTVTGSFISNGYSFKCDDFGTGTAWHGASMHKDLSKAVQDFSITVEVGFRTYADVDNLGRIEVYLRDSNGTIQGKMAIYDASLTMDLPKVASRLGSNKPLIDSDGGYLGAMRFWNLGQLRMKREGNVWKTYFAKYDENGKHIKQVYHEYTDVTGIASNPITRVQLSIGQYKDYDTVDEMFVSDIKVWENIEKPVVTPHVPRTFRTGDRLTIDCNNAEIRLNGEPYYSTLDPSSIFPNLTKGYNVLSMRPYGVLNPTYSKVTFRERWL